MITTSCHNCQKTLTYYPSKGIRKFCNNICQGEYKFNTDTVFRVDAGNCSDNRTLKKYLVRKFGEKCVLCDNGSTWNGKPLSLEVDHIDGNSDNNMPINLRLLCPNCHSQEPTTTNNHKKSHTRNLYIQKYRNLKHARIA